MTTHPSKVRPDDRWTATRSSAHRASLHGRERALSSLTTFLADLKQGRGAVLLIEGPAGIGKTRLLAEALRQARDLEILTAEATTNELDQVTPWGSLLQALDSSSPRLLAPEDIDPLRSELGARTAVIDRIRSTLESASTERPVLICIDDVQWADAQTLTALTALAPQLFSYPVGWLLARRPLPRPAELPRLLRQLEELQAEPLRLENLDEPATRAIAKDLLGPHAGPGLDRLIALSGGNPLFLLELARAYGGQDTPREPETEAATDDTPAPLRAAIEAHVRALPAQTAELVKVASVLGREFRPAVLARMTGMTTENVVSAMAPALTAEVVVHRGESLVFCHDLLRSVTYRSLPQSARRALHRDAAIALRDESAGLAPVANHFAQGASPGDEEAIEALSASASALFSTSPGPAADLALEAIRLLRDDDPRRGALVNAAVSLLGWIPRLEQAREVGQDYLRHYRPTSDVHAGIELGMRRAWFNQRLIPYPGQLPGFLLTDPTVPAGVRASLAILEQVDGIWYGDLHAVDHELRRTAELARSAGQEYDAKAAETLAVLNFQMSGRLADGLQRARTSTGGQLPGTRAMYQMDLARSLASLGHTKEARIGLDEAIRNAESSGVGAIAGSLRFLRALLLCFEGRLSDARAEARVQLDGVESHTFTNTHGLLLGLLTEVSIRQGDVHDAQAASRQLNQFTEDDDLFVEKFWTAALCHEARGRLHEAVTALGPALDLARRGRPVVAVWRLDRLPHLVSLALRAGSAAVAADAAEISSQLSQHSPGESLPAALARHSKGLLTGNVRMLREAVDELATCEWPLAAARAREDLAFALAREGMNDDAVTQLEAAFAIHTEAAGYADAARVRSALRGLGVHKPRPSAPTSSHGWASLTKAELAVVRAVSSGCTNREAATELFLSPDTVNTHLRHVFAKLGVRSRVELARLAMDNPLATSAGAGDSAR